MFLCIQIPDDGDLSPKHFRRYKLIYDFRRFRKFGKSDYWLCHVCLSASMELLGFHSKGFQEIIFMYFSKTCPEKFQFHSNLSRITGTLHEKLRTFIITPRSVLLRMYNVSDKSCRENRNTRFTFTNAFVFENRIVWDKFGKILYSRTSQTTIWRMRNACWIPKATHTHSEYTVLISFPPQQWSHESASGLRYTYIARLLFYYVQLLVYMDVTSSTIYGSQCHYESFCLLVSNAV